MARSGACDDAGADRARAGWWSGRRGSGALGPLPDAAGRTLCGSAETAAGVLVLVAISASGPWGDAGPWPARLSAPQGRVDARCGLTQDPGYDAGRRTGPGAQVSAGTRRPSRAGGVRARR